MSRLPATPHVGSLQRHPSPRLPPPASRSDLPSRCSDEDLNHAAIGPAFGSAWCMCSGGTSLRARSGHSLQMQTAECLLSDSRSSKRLILAREAFVRICFRISTANMPQQHAGRTEICFSKQGSQNSDRPSARTSSVSASCLPRRIRTMRPSHEGQGVHCTVLSCSSAAQACPQPIMPGRLQRWSSRVKQHRRRSSGFAPRFPQRQASAGRSCQLWPLTCCRASHVHLVRGNRVIMRMDG